MLSNIDRALERVRERIRAATHQYHRKTDSVSLIAVSKTKSVASIITAIDAGQRLFGENYVQEAVNKIEQINNPELQWHFLGPIQSNKTRLIASNFNWVHSVDRFKIAKRLSDQRPNNMPRLNICLQVNVSSEESKSGVLLSELSNLLGAVIELPNLHLRGFMVIPKKELTFAEQRKPFAVMSKAKDNMSDKFNITLDTLSMGMSADLEAAIAEGASHVRVGTDIFGAR